MRSPTAATIAALSSAFTQPGILVQMGFSSVLRYSSRGDVVWNGATWQANNVRINGLQEAANGSASISLIVGNSDGAFGTLCLAEPPQEVPISIWAFYEGALAVADPVQIFAGVIDSCEMDERTTVALQCNDLNQRTLFVPRARISRATGFNRLIPAGRLIEWNGQRYEFSSGT